MWKNCFKFKFFKFEFFKPNLESLNFCVQFLFVEFFLIIHVFGKWWLIMCLFFSVGIFGHCTFNYTHCIWFLHIAFHLHNYIVYFFNTLHFFFLSIIYKCLGWFSYSWKNIILAIFYFLFLISPSRTIIFW
jgi:hypothetical protein